MNESYGCDEDRECGNCRITIKEREDGRVIEFLIGLNDEYAHIRTHILALRELLSLDIVYDMALNDESQQKVTTHSFVEASSLYSSQQESHGYAKGQMRNIPGKIRGRLFCTYCLMSGHTKEFCYKLNGYPPGHKLYKGNMRSTDRGNDHTKAVNRVSFDNATSDEKAESSKSDQLPQLSISQINQILAALKKIETDGGEGITHMAGWSRDYIR